jgi:hypothetical protein
MNTKTVEANLLPTVRLPLAYWISVMT